MKDERGVLLVATARGMEPMDRQRFAAGFTAKWECSRLLGDGLVHAFSPTRTHVLLHDSVIEQQGWATFCESGLSHHDLPGASVPKENVTCVRCVSKT